MAQVIPKGMKFYENPEKELEKAFKEYEDRFGKGSVDRMMPLVDPLNPDPVADMKAIQKLRKAVKTGRRLPEIPKEMRDTMLYQITLHTMFKHEPSAIQLSTLEITGTTKLKVDTPNSLGASAFHLPKINLIQHMLTADLIKPQVSQGHGLTGMVQQFHDQTDVVVGLDVHAVCPSFAHRVRAQVVDV